MEETELRLRAGGATAVIDPARGGVLSSLNIAGRDVLLAPTDEWQPYPRWGSFLMAPWVGPLSRGRLAFKDGEWQLPPNEASSVEGIATLIEIFVFALAALALNRMPV